MIRRVSGVHTVKEHSAGRLQIKLGKNFNTVAYSILMGSSELRNLVDVLVTQPSRN